MRKDAAETKAANALKALGVESELWLGETDSSESALKLFRDTEATVKALAELGRAHPGITGFNFDLCACISLYSTASASDRFLCCLSHSQAAGGSLEATEEQAITKYLKAR